MKKYKFLALALILSACGYSSVYKKTVDMVNLVNVRNIEMSSLKRLPNERRVAQLVSRKLKQSFTADSSNAKYFIDTNILETVKTLAVLRDATEDRFELSLSARITIYSNEGKKLLERDLAAYSPYNVETSPYGTAAGKDRARENAASVLADKINQQINYFLYTIKQDD